MSSQPPPGPSGGGISKAKTKSSVPRGSRVRALAAGQAGAKSSSSSSEDGQQAARARRPLSSVPTEGAGPSRGIASPAHLDVNVLNNAIAGLNTNRAGSTINMDQLPPWAQPLARKDPVTGRPIPPRPRPLSCSSSTAAGANPIGPTTLHRTGVVLPDQDKDSIWYMMVTPIGNSSGPRRTILCKWNLPRLDPDTTAEELRRVETIQYMSAVVRRFRSGGGPPYRYGGPYRPAEKRYIDKALGWILEVDEVNRLMTDLSMTTVWMNPFRLDMLYLTLATLLADLYNLAFPHRE